MQDQRFSLTAVPLSISDNPARVAYLRQVLGHLVFGLLAAGAGAQFGLSPAVLPVVAGHPILGLLAIIGLMIWAQSAARGPRAGLAYYLFTFGMGLTIAPTLAYVLAGRGGTGVLALAGTVTLANALALFAYAWVSKKDFSFLGGFLFTGLFTMILAQLLNYFWLQSPVMDMAVPCILIILFNGFILFDLSRILQRPGTIPPTVAAMLLFLDLVNLFLSWLRVLDRD